MLSLDDVRDALEIEFGAFAPLAALLWVQRDQHNQHMNQAQMDKIAARHCAVRTSWFVRESDHLFVSFAALAVIVAAVAKEMLQ